MKKIYCPVCGKKRPYNTHEVNTNPRTTIYNCAKCGRVVHSEVQTSPVSGRQDF